MINNDSRNWSTFFRDEYGKLLQKKYFNMKIHIIDSCKPNTNITKSVDTCLL